MARAVERGRVATRLAGRDLDRFRSRSVGAIGAISLALGAAVAVVLGTSAALFASDAEGNLAPNEVMVRTGEIPGSGDVAPIPDLSESEISNLESDVARIAAGLDGARITPVDVAVAPDEQGFGGVPAVVLTREMEPGMNRILTYLYVASDPLLDHYDLDLSALGGDVEVVTAEDGPLFFEPMRPEPVMKYLSVDSSYSSLPGSFMTPAGLEVRGWNRARAGWLLEGSGPITDAQFDRVRLIAASSGMTVEGRADQANLRSVRTAATAAGIAVALGVLAMTVGLIRVEASPDMRTLTATGASKRIRRSVTAATTGLLAVGGSALGAFGAISGFLAGYHDDLGALTPLPAAQLLTIVFGLPILGAAVSWLLAGSEPTSIVRRAD
jgi:putative ABC transport system permease protein